MVTGLFIDDAHVCVEIASNPINHLVIGSHEYAIRLIHCQVISDLNLKLQLMWQFYERMYLTGLFLVKRRKLG